MTNIFQIIIKGEIVNGWWCCTSDMVAGILDKYNDKKVRVLINSLGGDATEAFTISSLFRLHGDVEVHYIGNNASAATIASMGAKRVTIDSSAMYLVHQCGSVQFDWDIYNADQLEQKIKALRETQEDLRKFDDVAASMYAQRCKKNKEELLALMKRGGWLTAQEALDWGFVDEITDDPREKSKESVVDTIKAVAAAGLPPIPGLEPSFKDKIKKFFTEPNFKKMEKETTQDPVEETGAPSGNEKQENGDETATAEEVKALKEKILALETELKTTAAERDKFKALVDGKPADVTKQVITQPKEQPKATAVDRIMASAKSAREMLDFLK